jgi:hypothetical protein
MHFFCQYMQNVPLRDSEQYKTMEAIVNGELEEFINIFMAKSKDHPLYSNLDEDSLKKRAISDYYNNFIYKLPGWSIDPEMMEDLKKRGKEQLIDKFYGSTLKVQRAAEPLLEQLGIERVVLQKLIDACFVDRSSENYHALVDYTRSLYVALRMQGFSHHPDLTS